MLTPRSLSFYGAYSLRRQLPAEMLVSVGADMALMGQFLLARLFDPGPESVTLLFVLQHVSFFLAPWFAERFRASPSRTLYPLLLVAPAALISTAFFSGFWAYGIAFVVANVAFITVLVPLRNRLLRSNYTDAERGGCYGACKGMGILTSFGFMYGGALALEYDPGAIAWLLPTVGVISAVGILLFRRIRLRGEDRLIRREAARRRSAPWHVYADLFRLFARDRRFLLYQLGWLVYGLGFMFTMPQEINALAETIKPTYPVLVVGAFGITPAIKILFMPFFGRLLDRAGPSRTAAVGFGLLVFYPLTILAAIRLESVAVWLVARALFGLAMSAVELVWTIGAVSFGEASRASTLTAAHIFAVGFRGSFAPFLGTAVATSLGSGVFLLAAGFLVVASVQMARLKPPTGPEAPGSGR